MGKKRMLDLGELPVPRFPAPFLPLKDEGVLGTVNARHDIAGDGSAIPFHTDQGANGGALLSGVKGDLGMVAPHSEDKEMAANFPGLLEKPLFVVLIEVLEFVCDEMIKLLPITVADSFE